jgi:hypothetical protein
MALSIFLAKILGVYLIIMFLLFATRKEEVTQAIKAFLADHGLILISGDISLIAGLAILIGHPIWVWEWPLVITLLGLLMVIRGILRIGYPACTIRWGNSLLRSRQAWSWTMIVSLIIGIFLLAHGFMA